MDERGGGMSQPCRVFHLPLPRVALQKRGRMLCLKRALGFQEQFPGMQKLATQTHDPAGGDVGGSRFKGGKPQWVALFLLLLLPPLNVGLSVHCISVKTRPLATGMP